MSGSARPAPGTVLRIDRRTRTVLTGILRFVAGVGFAGGILSLTGVIHNPNPPRETAAMALILIAAPAMFIAGVHRSRVVVNPDAIEVTRYLGPTRRVLLADIVAREWHPSGYRSAPFHILITRDGRRVSLPPYLEHPAVLQAVLRDIPLQPYRRWF